MAIDFTQFFNPSAWGAWAPPSSGQGIVSPQVAGSAFAPAPAGAPIARAPLPPAIASPSNPAAPAIGQNQTLAASQPGNPAGGSQGWGGLLQRAAAMVKPQMPAPPPIQMARPAGNTLNPGMLNGAQSPAMLQRLQRVGQYGRGM